MCGKFVVPLHRKRKGNEMQTNRNNKNICKNTTKYPNIQIEYKQK